MTLTYLERPAIRRQIQAMHDGASFLDPGKELTRGLLLELGKPTVTNEFKALVGDSFEQSQIQQAVTQSLPKNASPSDNQAAMTDVQQRLAALNVNSTSAIRRSTMMRSTLIEISAQSPASKNARTRVFPDS